MDPECEKCAGQKHGDCSNQCWCYSPSDRDLEREIISEADGKTKGSRGWLGPAGTKPETILEAVERLEASHAH